jgi:hypothetical protein
VKAIQCLQRMEHEGKQREWTLYKDGRIKVEAIKVWSILRKGLRQEVSEFNRQFQDAGLDAPLSIDDREAIITIRKIKYPLHETLIMLELPDRTFVLSRKNAPDGVTEPTLTHEAVTLDLGADDNLYLTYNGEQLSGFDLPNALMKKVFETCR